MQNSLMNQKVLVLNQSYEPLMVVNAKRAIVLVLKNKVELLEKYNNSIRTVSNKFESPSVIRLNFYVRIKYKNTPISRKHILRRDNNRCQYCDKKAIPLTIDHVIPRNKGGKDTWENLVAACVRCNTKKGDRLLKEIGMGLLKEPRRPSKIFQLQSYVNQTKNNWKPYLFMERT